MKAQYKDPVFTTPDFLQAIKAADFEAVKDLVTNKGANVNAVDRSMVPVFAHAIYSKNAPIIAFFLQQGAHVNPEYQNVAITPLGAACRVASMADSTENINYTFGKLFDLGAQLNPENCRSAPLTEIIQANGPCSGIMAQYLVKLGANINPTGYAITPLAAATGVAIQNFTLDPINTCLQLGAQINPINPFQVSPLMTVVRFNTPVAKIIAKYLIDNGAEVQPSPYSYNCPLYQAVALNNKDIYELLIENGGDLNKNYSDNASFSTLAILNGNLDMLKLISKGVKISWDQALELSLNNSQASAIEITKFLLSKAEKYDKKELLVKAINYGNQIIADLLVAEYGAIDLSDYQGHFNLTTSLAREMAIKFNHPSSKILKIVNSGNIDAIFQTTESLIKYPSLDKSNVCQLLTNIREVHGPKLIQKILKDNSGDASKITKTITLFELKYTFKNDKFVLTTQTSGNEIAKDDLNQPCQGNLPEIKAQSKTYIKDGKFYLAANDKLLDDSAVNNLADIGTHYVVNKKGTLFVNAKGYTMCHSYFLKGTEGKTYLDDISMYGYGKPVACGGHIKFKGGLITKITNGSGHYRPNSDQLKLVCKYFNDLGVLSNDVVIEAYSHGVGSCVKVENSDFLDSVVVGDILEQYSELG